MRMAYYAVEYVYNPSMTETMNEVRPTHRAFLSGLLEQGINVASGPLAGEVPGALILINASSEADVEQILNQDPFYVAEVIQARLIREWNPVIRTQLSLKRLQLIEQLNRRVKHNVISDIRFI